MCIRHVTMTVRFYLRLCFACRLCSCLGVFLTSVQRATNLSQWLNGKRHAMPFAVPMVWREPSNHTTDCYFCTVPPVSGGIAKKKKWTIVYPNIPSALRPVPHGKEFPFPNLRKNLPSIQKTRNKASRPRVLLSCRRLLKHTSSTVGLLRHTHTFSHRTN